MPITIGTNIASLKAQNQLGKSSRELGGVYERLSSGLRINKASDDAAGLSIADSLRSDRRVFTQGIRNFNDGISLLTIADSAIESLSNIVVRLKELAEQSANGVYSASQRKALDKEAQALSEEYLRVQQTTKFNGRSLLNGDLGELRLQGGYSVNGGIQSSLGGKIGTGAITLTSTSDQSSGVVTLGDFNNDGNLDVVGSDYSDGLLRVKLGNGAGGFTETASAAQFFEAPIDIASADFNNDGNLDLVAGNGETGGLSIALGDGKGSFASQRIFLSGQDINSLVVGDFNGDGNSDVAYGQYGSSTLSIALGTGTGALQAGQTLTTFGSTISELVTGDFNGDGAADLAYGGSGEVGVYLGSGNGTFAPHVSFSAGSPIVSFALGDVNNDGKLDLLGGNTSDRVAIYIGRGNGNFDEHGSYEVGISISKIKLADLNGDGFDDLVSASNDSAVSVHFSRGNGSFEYGALHATGGPSTQLETGDVNGDGVFDIISLEYAVFQQSLFLGNSKSGVAPLLPFDLSTMVGARQALPAFDKKLQQLSSQRGQIGAFQSRIQVGINNLQTAAENYASAESRIRDADIAQESANLVRLQILQQASASILGQANLQPQIALALLKGGES